MPVRFHTEALVVCTLSLATSPTLADPALWVACQSERWIMRGTIMHRWMKWSAALTASVAMAAVCGAAQAQDASGDWHGTLTAPTGAMLRIGVTLKPTAGGAYEGSLASPDQGGAVIPLDQAKVENGTLSFSIAAIVGSYSGRWDDARKAWVGQWTQTAALPLVLTAGKP